MNFNFDDVKNYYNHFYVKSFGNELIAYDRHSNVPFNNLFTTIGASFAHAWVNSLSQNENAENEALSAFNEDAKKLYNELMKIYINDLMEDNAVREGFCLHETLLDLELNQNMINNLVTSLSNNELVSKTFEKWARYASKNPSLYPEDKTKSTLR